MSKQGVSPSSEGVGQASEPTLDHPLGASGLANIFAQERLQAQETEEQPQPEGEEEPQAEQEDSQPDDSEELLEEPEPEEENSDEDVLSQQEEDGDEELQELDIRKAQKRIRKDRKQIDKLTARAKSAEELNSDLQGRLEKLEKAAQDKKTQEQPIIEQARNANTVEELQTLFNQAEKAEEEIEDYLDRFDEEEIELNGQPATKQQLRDSRKLARQTKKEAQKRFQYLESKAKYDQAALERFPFLNDETSEGYALAQKAMATPVFQRLAKDSPDTSFQLGVYVKGLMAIQAEEQKAKQPEPKPKVAPKKKQAVAPNVPGTTATASPGGMHESPQKPPTPSAVTAGGLAELFAAERAAKA